jgi:hypothetical protein
LAEIVGRDVEEALDLAGVQLQRQHPIGAGGGDEVGHQLGRDRRARLDLAILPGIAEVRDDGDDRASRGALQRVDHDQKLHQVLVHRRAGRLHHKAVHPANILADLNEDLSVGKRADQGLTRANLDGLADGVGVVAIGVAGKDRERLQHEAGVVGAVGFEPTNAGSKDP